MSEIRLSNGIVVKMDLAAYRLLSIYKWSAMAGHVWRCGYFSNEVDYWLGWRTKDLEWSGQRIQWKLHRMVAGVPRFFRYYPKNGEWEDIRFENIGLKDWKDNEYQFREFSKASVFKGVRWDGYYGLWRSEISGLVIGYYWNEVDAARAYNVKYKEIFRNEEGLNDIKIVKEYLKNNKRSQKVEKGLEI